MKYEEKLGPNRLKEELEVLAAMGATCSIRFMHFNGNEVSLKTRISRLYEEGGVDYVLVDDGLQIPYSKLIEVNGIRSEHLC